MSQVLDFPKPSKDLFWISLLSSSASLAKETPVQRTLAPRILLFSRRWICAISLLAVSATPGYHLGFLARSLVHVTRLSQRTHVEPLVSIA